MIDQASKEHLLEHEDGNIHASARLKCFTVSRFAILALLLCFLVSLDLNVVLYFGRPEHGKSDGVEVSQYTGLRKDVPSVYNFFTEYWPGEDENKTQSDILWEDINISNIAVALSSDYIKEHSLEDSHPFPWDTDKQVYYVKAYHHLHCLKVMRHSFDEYITQGKSTIAPHHIYHCLDAIRQDTMCRADDTPMPIPVVLYGRKNIVGEGQHLMCRDMKKLDKWIHEPERDACYGQIADYITLVHTVERFGFCPEDSIYHPVMEQYFDINGHKDPYGGD